MKEGTSNIISGSTIIIIGILLLLETTKAQYAGMEDGLGTGPSFFPQVLMIGFILTGTLTIFNGIKHKGNFLPRINWPKVLIFISLTSVLFFSVSRLGFLLSAFPFLLVAMWVMEFRKKIWIFFISLGFSLCSWYLFNFVFEITLPTSPWFIYV
jgi:hypothetical protein